MSKVAAIGLSAAMLVMLNGCLLTSPHWNQELDDHTDAVSLQAFTIDKSKAVKFECAQAYHGGLYPAVATANWVVVANVNPQSQALLDAGGSKVYGAGKSKVLPASCWRFDPANSIWYTAVRATQNTTVMDTKQKYFYTFTKTGLECVGRENGKVAGWFGWYKKGCESGAYYTIFRAVA